MSKFRTLIHSVGPYCISVGLSIVVMLGGCERKTQKFDWNAWGFQLSMYRLTEISESAQSPRVRESFRAALAKLKNGVVDPKPILIEAAYRPVETGTKEAVLFVCFLDEDRNLRGLRIREEYTDSTISLLEEDYPVYIYGPNVPIHNSNVFPAKVRDKSQRKDDQAWLKYTKWALGMVHRKGTSHTEAQEIDMPPIWISIPDPNKVRVFASLYDKAGNESESFEIENLFHFYKPNSAHDKAVHEPEGCDLENLRRAEKEWYELLDKLEKHGKVEVEVEK